MKYEELRRLTDFIRTFIEEYKRDNGVKELTEEHKYVISESVPVSCWILFGKKRFHEEAFKCIVWRTAMRLL